MKLLFILMVGISFSYDKIVLNTGQVYNGTFITFQGENVIFKPENSLVGQPIKIKKVSSIELNDGTIIPLSYKLSKINNYYNAGLSIKKAGDLYALGDVLTVVSILGSVLKPSEPITWAIFSLVSMGCRFIAHTELSIAGEAIIEAES